MSNIGGLSAMPAEMIQDGQEVKNQAAEFAATLSSLSAFMNHLHELWPEGPAVQALMGKYEEFSNILSGFQALLEDKGDRVIQAGITMDQTEADNTAMSNRIGN